MQKSILLIVMVTLTGWSGGCVVGNKVEPRGSDQFGRTGNNPQPALPFQADHYVVRVGDLEYNPDVITVRGEWMQLRWLEDGNYRPDDVWIPRSAISAIEEKHD